MLTKRSGASAPCSTGQRQRPIPSQDWNFSTLWASMRRKKETRKGTCFLSQTIENRNSMGRKSGTSSFSPFSWGRPREEKIILASSRFSGPSWTDMGRMKSVSFFGPFMENRRGRVIGLRMSSGRFSHLQEEKKRRGFVFGLSTDKRRNSVSQAPNSSYGQFSSIKQRIWTRRIR